MTAPAVVVGGSVAGLATALALAGKGCRVRVLEGAPPPPEGPAAKVAELWRRPGVPQSVQSHVLTSLGVRVLRTSAPRVLEAALREGARLLDLTEAAPRTAGGFVREAADEELVALAVRRPVFELVLRDVVRSLPNVEISHGQKVSGLLMDASRSRARGVVTESGERVPARFVVDATGRTGASRSWLGALGVHVAPDLVAPTHLRAFTRFYRLRSPGPQNALPGPLNRGNAAGGIWDHYAAVAHPADNGVFALTLGVPTGDPATAALRTARAFTAAARLSPWLEPWVAPDVAEPMGPVRTITMPRNVLRAVVLPAGPAAPHQALVAGLFSVGDSACVTDPLFGRGMSLALAHAFRLADLLDSPTAAGEPPGEGAARLADELYRPWFEQAVQDDAARIELWRARADGTVPVLPEQAVPGRPSLASVARAAEADATVWRGFTRVLMGLTTPARCYDNEAFRDRVRAAPEAAAAGGPRPPTREDLVRAIAAAEGA
ncbi:FAD-dependent monooxygenase [Streptomyces sp. NPDC057616]|uniref:FAD-dependent monooxygenase n=1 Tax=Streptomyces sp. NPDC057616 TaxID=3346183 RepID=UPI00368D096C